MLVTFTTTAIATRVLNRIELTISIVVRDATVVRVVIPSSISLKFHVVILCMRNDQLLLQLDADLFSFELFVHDHLGVVF